RSGPRTMGSLLAIRSSLTSCRRCVAVSLATLDPGHRHAFSTQGRSEFLIPVPFRPRSAAVKIERRSAVFRICVTRQVRFRQRDQPCNTAFALKLMPHRTDRLEAELRHNAAEKRTKQCLVAEPFRITSGGLY